MLLLLLLLLVMLKAAMWQRSRYWARLRVHYVCTIQGSN